MQLKIKAMKSQSYIKIYQMNEAMKNQDNEKSRH